MKISDGKSRTQPGAEREDLNKSLPSFTIVSVIGDSTAKKGYDICWRETYEISATVEASSLEEALRIARDIRDNKSPKLTEPDRWEMDDEEGDFAFEIYSSDPEETNNSRDQAVMAEFIEAGRIECLPSPETGVEEDR